MESSDSVDTPRGPRRVPAIWGSVPQRNRDFTGREDLLLQLRAGISTDVTAVVPHALHGLGGVGKTQLAIEYAWRFQSDYDIVWWIPADQPVLVRASLAGLAPYLGLPPATTTGIEDAATAVLDSLRCGDPYNRWLLIFDNADQPEDINDFIPRGPGHVLITSRNDRWEAVGDPVLVNVFHRAESVAFLNKRVANVISEPDATQLAEELGDLPLALGQAGALQAETGMSVDEYLRLLKEQTSELLAGNHPSGYPLSMTAAWKLSVAKLIEQLPDAVDLLRCCAFFGADPIPRDVFSRTIQDVQPQLGALLAEPILLAKAIRELGRFGLAHIDPASRTIQVHRLIQALLREELSPEQQRPFRHDVHLLLAAAAPKNPDDNAQWPVYAELAAHVVPSRLDECQDPTVRRLALDIARYLSQSGDRPASRALLERLLDRWKADSGEQSQEFMDASERNARIAVVDRRYAEARDDIAHIAEIDPARASQLSEEFGRLIRFDEDKRTERIDWLTGIWAAMTATIEYDWPLLDPANRSIIETRPDDDRLPNLDGEPAHEAATEEPVVNQLQLRASAQVLGSSLEDSFMKLLRRLFFMDNDAETKVISRLRVQSAGSQFGHDIEFDAQDACGNGIRCHVECKNYRSVIKLANIADKLLQTEFYWSNMRLDHWILISPHVDASNELNLMVQSWNDAQRYPFNIQLWTPELGIRDLFRTAPDVYETIYGTKHHEQLSPVLADKLLEEWRARITPVARASNAWLRYLRNFASHCFPDEDGTHFEEIYSNHISLQALVENGLPANISLEAAVRDWLGTAESRSLLLLAEFGEGKSFFTYSLSRRLAEEFLKRPDDGWVPLRLPLRALRAHPNVSSLLASRLAEIGTEVAEWRQLVRSYKTLVLLDGFDEMSIRLDPLTVSQNIHALADCLEQFGQSKILITSRTHFFENRRDHQRFLDHAGHPQIYRIAPISRARRVENLSAHAKRIDAEEKLRQLKRLYDPIGLAAKPLFLQMIKETLPRLPDDRFDELVLYQQYTRQSLERKLHDLRDELSTVIDQELINNLHLILEDIAVSLHTSQVPYIDLKEFSTRGSGNLAEVLWKMSDTSSAAQPLGSDPEIQRKDARARLGIRSLLKPVRNVAGDFWPVDFFHRSMREYFVGRALVRAIADDRQRATQLLSHVPLLPEVLNFAVLLMRQPRDILDEGRPGSLFEDTLYSLARSAVLPMYTDKHLGGNAISLLYALTRQLPHTDWSGLALDYAYLAGANLRGMSFRDSSMRYANLDNTQLGGADFRGADLTGVQLEETAGVVDLVVDEDQNAIYGAYGDNTVRRWSLAPGGRATSHTVCQTPFPPQSLEFSPFGDLVVRGKERLLVLSRGDSSDSWDVVSNFRLRPDILDISVQRRSVAVQREFRKLEFVLHLYEPQERDTQASLTIDCAGPFRFISPKAVFVSTGDGRLALQSVTHEGSQVTRVFDVPHMSCIDAKVLDERESLVVLGHGSGDVSLLRVHSNESSVSVEEIWRISAHAGVVTTVQLSDSFVVSGGVDRTICLFTLSDQWQAGEPLRLHRTLSCEGIRIDGVKGERERQLLQALIETS